MIGNCEYEGERGKKWRDKGKYCLHQGLGLLTLGYTSCIKLNEF